MRRGWRGIRVWAIGLVLLAFGPAGFASDGRLLTVAGEVFVQRMSTGEPRRLRARAGFGLESGDTVQTGTDGRAQIRFTDGGIVSLQSLTTFRIDDYRFGKGEQRGFFSLLRGALRAASGLIGKRDHDDYRLRTPTAVIGIRGTQYLAIENDCVPRCAPGTRRGLHAAVTVGRIVVSNAAGSVELAAGEAAHVDGPDSAPERTTDMPVLPPPTTITRTDAGGEGGGSGGATGDSSGGSKSAGGHPAKETLAAGTEAAKNTTAQHPDAQAAARPGSAPASDSSEGSTGSGADATDAGSTSPTLAGALAPAGASASHSDTVVGSTTDSTDTGSGIADAQGGGGSGGGFRDGGARADRMADPATGRSRTASADLAGSTSSAATNASTTDGSTAGSAGRATSPGQVPVPWPTPFAMPLPGGATVEAGGDAGPGATADTAGPSAGPGQGTAGDGNGLSSPIAVGSATARRRHRQSSRRTTRQRRGSGRHRTLVHQAPIRSPPPVRARLPRQSVRMGGRAGGCRRASVQPDGGHGRIQVDAGSDATEPGSPAVLVAPKVGSAASHRPRVVARRFRLDRDHGRRDRRRIERIRRRALPDRRSLPGVNVQGGSH
ncbi:MAG: FecR domain-containing protein [Burkholderiaceae bacterium]